MAGATAIEWTDTTWNPVTGCTEVSPGCDHCYAKRFAERFRGVAGHPYEQGFDVRLWPERLDLPLYWRKPRRVFVNSMSDLFHQDVPDSFIDRVFSVMSRASWHTFQLLTKRPDRLKRYVMRRRYVMSGPGSSWPPANLWLGTSVESQEFTWRVDKLLATPASVRFLSCEPLLGPLDLGPYLGLRSPGYRHVVGETVAQCWGVDWVIVGGESGPGARSLQLDWVRDLRDQCVDAEVPFFFKQVGGRTPKAGGRELDGRTWDEYPETTGPFVFEAAPVHAPSSARCADGL